MRLAPSLALAMLVPVFPISAQTVTDDQIDALLRQQRCSEARKRIESAPNRAQFLGTAKGRAYFAVAACGSPPEEMKDTKMLNGLREYATSARSQLGEKDQ